MEDWEACFSRVTEALAGVSRSALDAFVEILCDATEQRKLVFVIGNGGSASAASHFAQDITRAAYDGAREQLRVFCLSDSMPLMSAIANDVGYEFVFEQQLRQFASPGDVLIAISGSGNSRNILKAAEFALERDLRLVGVTGFDGGGLAKRAECRVHVPFNDMAVAESCHAAILHAVTGRLKERLRRRSEAGTVDLTAAIPGSGGERAPHVMDSRHDL